LEGWVSLELIEVRRMERKNVHGATERIGGKVTGGGGGHSGPIKVGGGIRGRGVRTSRKGKNKKGNINWEAGCGGKGRRGPANKKNVPG